MAQSSTRLTRRRFLQLMAAGAAGIAGSGALTGFYSWLIEPFWIDCTRLRISVRGWSPPRPLRIVHVTDLHLSDIIPVRYLVRAIELAVSFAPDILAVTGDLITNDAQLYLPDLQRIMRGARAKLGVLAVFGNHEYGVWRASGKQFEPDRSELIARILADSGIQTLNNQRLDYADASFEVIGVDDLWAGKATAGTLLAQSTPRTPDKARIVLCHNPDLAQVLAPHADLILAGHTHGGQVVVPFFGPPLLPVNNRTYAAGLFAIDHCQLYVNRGLGYLKQIRFRCRPEIVVVDVQGQDS